MSFVILRFFHLMWYSLVYLWDCFAPMIANLLVCLLKLLILCPRPAHFLRVWILSSKYSFPWSYLLIVPWLSYHLIVTYNEVQYKSITERASKIWYNLDSCSWLHLFERLSFCKVLAAPVHLDIIYCCICFFLLYSLQKWQLLQKTVLSNCIGVGDFLN